MDQVGRSAQVVALAADTGAVRWRWRAGGTGLLGAQLPTADGGLAVVDSAGRTAVVDLTSGKTRWQSAGRVQAYGLGVAGSTVLRGAGGQLTSYDEATGHVLWRHPTVNPASLNAIDGTAIVTGAAVGPSIDGAATAYDAKTGRRLWRLATRHAYGWGGGSADGIALVDQDGSRPGLSFVDAGTGEVLWHSTTQIALYLPALVTPTTLTTIEGGTSLQRAVELVERERRSGSVLSEARLVAPLSGPVRLTDSRVAVIEAGQQPQKPSAVVAYNGGRRAWSVAFPSFPKWVVAGPDGTAYVQTIDPMYGCTTASDEADVGRRGRGWTTGCP